MEGSVHVFSNEINYFVQVLHKLTKGNKANETFPVIKRSCRKCLSHQEKNQLKSLRLRLCMSYFFVKSCKKHLLKNGFVKQLLSN